MQRPKHLMITIYPCVWQTELTAKDQLVEKYQQMLQDARREHQQEMEGHRQEAAALREKLNTQADSAFSRLKQAALEAANISTPVIPTDRQLERLLQLEDLTAQQQQEIRRLQQQVPGLEWISNAECGGDVTHIGQPQCL
jgi:cell division septum initiation protein DivIVA